MKQEALEVLKNRRSIRKYKPEQVRAEDLQAVLDAGDVLAVDGKAVRGTGKDGEPNNHHRLSEGTSEGTG